jgi:hypothetical protein
MNKVNQTVFPESTLNAGLFAVGTAPVKLADLTDGQGKKLKIPASALKVLVRNGANHTDILWLEKPDGSATALLAQEGVELAVADLATHSVRADGDRGAVVVSYTRLTSDRE